MWKPERRKAAYIALAALVAVCVIDFFGAWAVKVYWIDAPSQSEVVDAK
jgi:hypothetical protein